jgi:hypothetical protein
VKHRTIEHAVDSGHASRARTVAWKDVVGRDASWKGYVLYFVVAVRVHVSGIWQLLQGTQLRSDIYFMTCDDCPLTAETRDRNFAFQKAGRASVFGACP